MIEYLIKLLILDGVVAGARVIGDHPWAALGIAVSVLLIAFITIRRESARPAVFLGLPAYGIWLCIQQRWGWAALVGIGWLSWVALLGHISELSKEKAARHAALQAVADVLARRRDQLATDPQTTKSPTL